MRIVRGYAALLVAMCCLGGAAAGDADGARMTGRFIGRGASTVIGPGAHPGRFHLVLKREVRNCAGEVSGEGRRIAPFALTMSIPDSGDGATCTIDLVYGPGYGTVQVTESAACLYWHGAACNFAGTLKRK